MKVLTIKEPKVIEYSVVSDKPTPVGFAKIRISKCGLSATDVNIYDGTKGVNYPIVPCHQAVGVISEIEQGASLFQRGQRVAISPYVPCGQCPACNEKNESMCINLNMLGISCDGLLSDFAVVPIQNLVELPQQVHDDEAIFIDNIAVALRIFHDMGAKKGDYIAIAGASFIGLILAQIALYYQAIPIIIDPSDKRLSLARTTGCYYFINASQDDPVQEVLKITGGRGCECVSYHASACETLQHSLNFASYGGTVAMTGWNHVTTLLPGSLTSIISKQLKVVGINNGIDYLSAAVNLLSNGAVDINPLIGRIEPFENASQIFDDLSKGIIAAEKIILKV